MSDYRRKLNNMLKSHDVGIGPTIIWMWYDKCYLMHADFFIKMCRNTGEFMMSRYREVAEIVIRYLEHRDRLVRLSITSLLPRIAHFLRDRFVTNYLTVCDIWLHFNDSSCFGLTGKSRWLRFTSCILTAVTSSLLILLLQICMNHILHVLKIPAERASGFIALGEMAGALDGELINYLPTITSHLRDAVCHICHCRCTWVTETVSR